MSAPAGHQVTSYRATTIVRNLQTSGIKWGDQKWPITGKKVLSQLRDQKALQTGTPFSGMKRLAVHDLQDCQDCDGTLLPHNDQYKPVRSRRPL